MKKLLALLTAALLLFALSSCASPVQNSSPVQSPATPAAAPPPSEISPAVAVDPSPAKASSTAISPTPASTTALGAQDIVFPRASSDEFPTPTAALQYFASCLAKNDFNSTLKVFPLYDLPEKFNYFAYSDRLQTVYLPTGYLPDPYREINRATLIWQAAQCCKSAVLGLSGMDWTMVQVQRVPEDTDGFPYKISPDKLADLKMQAADMEDSMSEDMKAKHRKNMAASAKVYGADECRFFYVTLACGENKVSCQGMQMLRYQGNWYIGAGTFNMEK